MEERSASLQRSRRRSSSTSNPNILSLTAFEQIFEPSTPTLTAANTSREFYLAQHLQVSQAEQSAFLQQFSPQDVDVNFEDVNDKAIPKTLQPYIPIERKCITLGTQTLRAQFNNTACQTEAFALSISSQLQCLQQREQELADIEEKIAIQLQELRNARSKLENDRAAIAREQTRIKVAERELKGKEHILNVQITQFNRRRATSFLKHLRTIDKHEKACKKWSWDLLRQAGVGLEYTLSAKVHRVVLTEFNNTKPSASPTCTPKARMQDNRMLEFSFKDHRSSLPIPSLALNNRSAKNQPKRTNIDGYLVCDSKERDLKESKEKDPKEPVGRAAPRKGINYPLNYKR